MKQCEQVRVLLEGHASSEGNSRRNQALSDQRALRTRRWLHDNDVDPAKVLGIVGYGSSIQRVDESTPESRRENRRVTILVKKGCP